MGTKIENVVNNFTVMVEKDKTITKAELTFVRHQLRDSDYFTPHVIVERAVIVPPTTTTP